MKSLARLIKTKNFKKKCFLDEKTIFFIVNKIIVDDFGNIGRENIFPEKIIKKTLILKTLGSNWSSEVWLRRNDIIRKINKKAESVVVDKIKI